MTDATQEIVRTCEALPPEKQIEVADFARFLLAHVEDEKWERLIASKKKLPRLEAFLQKSADEPEAPLDLDRL
jgi:hypothetical protein